MEVTWRTEGITHHGWWRHDDIGVLAVVTDPPTGRPVGRPRAVRLRTVTASTRID